jgi:hypothetical protein
MKKGVKRNVMIIIIIIIIISRIEVIDKGVTRQESTVSCFMRLGAGRLEVAAPLLKRVWTENSPFQRRERIVWSVRQN